MFHIRVTFRTNQLICISDNWITYNSEFSENALEKNNIKTLKDIAWGNSFWIDFYIQIMAKATEWTNVFRFTNEKDKNDENYGNRCPAIFVKSNRMTISNAVNDNNKYPMTDYLTVGKMYHVALSQSTNQNGSVIYKFILDGKQENAVENTKPIEKFINTKLYLSDNEYDSFGMYGRITELRYMRHSISKCIILPYACFWKDSHPFIVLHTLIVQRMNSRICIIILEMS